MSAASESPEPPRAPLPRWAVGLLLVGLVAAVVGWWAIRPECSRGVVTYSASGLGAGGRYCYPGAALLEQGGSAVITLVLPSDAEPPAARAG